LLKYREEGLLERQQLLDLLQDHHRQIGSVLAEAETALGRSDPERSKTLALIRWQLVRRLRSYQLFKHTELFDPLCRGGEAGKARMASAMKARCIDTAEAYDRHVKKWSACGIDSAWASYEQDSRAVIALIRQHLAREAAEAENLLAGSASPRWSAARGI
jgi:hypothetical protein